MDAHPTRIALHALNQSPPDPEPVVFHAGTVNEVGPRADEVRPSAVPTAISKELNELCGWPRSLAGMTVLFAFAVMLLCTSMASAAPDKVDHHVLARHGWRPGKRR